MQENDTPPSKPHPAFLTTRWTQVLASQGESTEALTALSELCAAYYSPVIAFLRRDGRDEDSARELAHEFFARILDRGTLGTADPSKGRFRSYLLGALKHFLSNRRQRDQREKRGGAAAHESIDERVEPIADPSGPPPDTVFDRAWALQVVERAMEQLAREARSSGREQEFTALKSCLTFDGEKSSTSALDSLGMTDGALRVAIHRLRRRFREAVRMEIARTVDTPADGEDELRHLISSLG